MFEEEEEEEEEREEVEALPLTPQAYSLAPVAVPGVATSGTGTGKEIPMLE